jgi:hypothetical protein
MRIALLYELQESLQQDAVVGLGHLKVVGVRRRPSLVQVRGVTIEQGVRRVLAADQVEGRHFLDYHAAKPRVDGGQPLHGRQPLGGVIPAALENRL